MPNLSTKYQRDYKDVEYSNPRLIRDREKRSRRWRVVFGLAVLIMLVALVYALFFSPIFEIKELKIIGLEKIKPESINNILNEYRDERRLFVFSNNNFWLFDAAEIKSLVARKYIFEKFEVKKRFPAGIEIDLKEKVSVINWLTNNFCYHLDMTGMALEYCDGATQNLTIKDMLNHTAVVGQEIITHDELVYIVELVEQFKMLMGERMKLQQVEKTENLMDFVSEVGPVVRFNGNLTQSEQVLRLSTLVAQPGFADKMAGLKYLDLRFGEKVYYQ